MQSFHILLLGFPLFTGTFIFIATKDRIHFPLLALVTPLVSSSVDTKALVTSLVTSLFPYVTSDLDFSFTSELKKLSVCIALYVYVML